MFSASSRALALKPEIGLCLAACVLALLATYILHAVNCVIFASSSALALKPKTGQCPAAWVLASLIYYILHPVDCMIFASSRVLARKPEIGSCLAITSMARWSAILAVPEHDLRCKSVARPSFGDVLADRAARIGLGKRWEIGKLWWIGALLFEIHARRLGVVHHRAVGAHLRPLDGDAHAEQALVTAGVVHRLFQRRVDIDPSGWLRGRRDGLVASIGIWLHLVLILFVCFSAFLFRRWMRLWHCHRFRPPGVVPYPQVESAVDTCRDVYVDRAMLRHRVDGGAHGLVEHAIGR